MKCFVDYFQDTNYDGCELSLNLKNVGKKGISPKSVTRLGIVDKNEALTKSVTRLGIVDKNKISALKFADESHSSPQNGNDNGFCQFIGFPRCKTQVKFIST